MTTNSKIGIGIAVLIVIGLAAFYGMRTHDMKMDMSDDAALPTSPNDTSDEALMKDSAAIDAQLDGLSDDNTSIDSGFEAESQ